MVTTQKKIIISKLIQIISKDGISTQITTNTISIKMVIIGVINEDIIIARIIGIQIRMVTITIKINGIKIIAFKKNKEISGNKKITIGIRLSNGQNKRTRLINL
jgi:phosphoribosyl-dephospho-CoA transferase